MLDSAFCLHLSYQKTVMLRVAVYAISSATAVNKRKFAPKIISHKPNIPVGSRCQVPILLDTVSAIKN